MYKHFSMIILTMVFATCLFAGNDNLRVGEEKDIGNKTSDLSTDLTDIENAKLNLSDEKSLINAIITVIPGSIAGTVTGQASSPIESVYVFVNKTAIFDYTNSDGEYSLEGVNVGEHDIYFLRDNYQDTCLTDVVVESGEVTTSNLVLRDEPQGQAMVWYGNVEGSTIEVSLNQRFDVLTYIQTLPDIYLGNIFLNLGAENQYIDSLLCQTEGEYYYPFTEWDIKEFQNVYGQPSNPIGWSSQAFQGYARFVDPFDNPLLHMEIPTLVLKFVVKTANNTANMGHIVHCLGKGYDPYQGPSNCGDSSGDYSYPVTEHHSPLYFSGDDIIGAVTNQYAAPLENVHAEILNFTRDDYTDINGDYRLNDLPPGYYNILFSHPNCEDEVRNNVRVFSGQNTVLNVTMQELGALEGVVTNTDMGFIQDVLVTIQGEGLTDSTDINGEYFIDRIPAGNFTVTFSHPNYSNQTFNNISITAGDTTRLDVTMPFLGAIDGVVKNLLGDPINGAHVSLIGQGLDDYTNQDGEFFFGMLDPGNYSVSLTHPDYGPKTVTGISVVSGDTAEVEIAMQLLGILDGVVSKTDGLTVLDDVLIRLLQGSSEVARCTTSAPGYYEITHLTAGNYDIEASKEGYVTQLIEDVYAQYDQIITTDILLVEDIGSISGIVSGGRAPIEGAHIAAISYPFHDFSNIDGEYELTGLPSGTYDLKFSKIGYEDYYANSVEVEPEQTTTLDVTLANKPYDVSIFLFSNSFYRAGYDGYYNCQYRNEGSATAANVIVELVLPEDADYISSTPVGDYDNGTITWTIGALNAGQTGDLWVDFNVAGSVSNGTVLAATSSITTDSPEVNLSNNLSSISAEVISDWNAFDKLASPLGIGTAHYISGEQELAYTVFFENEPGGTGTVTNITVSDTLDYDLDWDTFAFGPVGSPSTCSTHFDYTSGVLTWTFTDILLPDNTIPPEGEGFVNYNIKPYITLPNGTQITNRAAVKFDSDSWVVCPSFGPLLRTLDKQAPSSQVNSLPEFIIGGDTVTISWTATDYTGSGISAVEIYVSENDGPYDLGYIADPGEYSTLFQGEFDACYDFYSIAIDNVGNSEAAPVSSDAEVCFIFGYLYLPGDVNMFGGSWPPAAIGGDVTYLVNYYRGYMGSIPCRFDGFWASADANGDCILTGPDVTFMVTYFRGHHPSLLYCPDYEPAWKTWHDIPAEMPVGWPPCTPPDEPPPPGGGIVYVAVGTSGLAIVNIGENIDMVSTCSIPGRSNDLFVQDDYAYVVDSNNGGNFSIVDISDSLAPDLVTNISTGDCAYGLFVRGNYAYVANGFNGLNVIDITNKLLPAIIGQCDTPGSAAGVTLVNNYAFVSDHEYTLQVIDISIPSNPHIVATEVVSGYARTDVEIVGNYAYIATWEAGLRIFDISYPLDPVLIGSLVMPYEALDVVVVGNYAYLTDYDYGIRIIDISNPAYPSEINGYSAHGVRSISKSAEYIYVTQSNALLVFYATGGGQNLQLFDSIVTPSEALDVFVPSTRGFFRK